MASIEPAACCVRGLHWELSFESIRIEEVRLAMSPSGFLDCTRMPEILVFQNSPGDRVIIVPATGRIQLRLDLATKKEDRANRAQRITQELLDKALQQRVSSPGIITH